MSGNCIREDYYSNRLKNNFTRLRLDIILALLQVLNSITDKAEGLVTKEDLGLGQTIGETKYGIYKGESKEYILVSGSRYIMIEL